MKCGRIIVAAVMYSSGLVTQQCVRSAIRYRVAKTIIAHIGLIKNIPVEVVIQTKPEHAQKIQTDLRDCLGREIEPEEYEACFFVVQGLDETAALRLQQSMARNDLVDACYLKPKGEAP